MKNLLLLPLAAMLCAACTHNEPEPTQDYTSFVITLNKGTEQSNVTLRNVVSGYFDKNGYCWKIAKHGTLSSNPQTEKLTTEEYTLTIDTDSVYIFSDYNNIIMFRKPLVIQKNRKNTINLDEHPSAKSGLNKEDSTQYPQ